MEQLESALKAFATQVGSEAGALTLSLTNPYPNPNPTPLPNQVNSELTYLREKLVPDEADAHRHHHSRSRSRKNVVASGAPSAASSPVTCSMRPATLAVLTLRRHVREWWAMAVLLLHRGTVVSAMLL